LSNEVTKYLLSIGFEQTEPFDNEMCVFFVKENNYLKKSTTYIQYNFKDFEMNLFWGNSIQLQNFKIQTKEELIYFTSRSEVFRNTFQ